MSSFILVSLIFTTPAHAGWLKDWCSRHLVAEDPYPFAEYSADYLITVYRKTGHEGMGRELLYKYAFGLLTLEQRGQVQELLSQNMEVVREGERVR